MESRSKKFEAIQQWIGRVPTHGEVLGLNTTCFEISALMSHRSVSDIESLLDILNDCATSMGEANLAEPQMPLPEFNWQLHGTGVGRLASFAINDPRARALSAERWELVAVVALHTAKKAVESLRAEPIGLGALPLVASPKSQKLATGAKQWFILAFKEQQRKFISTGRKQWASIEKGNKSPHKSDQKNARRVIITKETKEIRQKNPKLSRYAIAKEISKNHPEEAGYRIRTAYEVVKDVLKK